MPTLLDADVSKSFGASRDFDLIETILEIGHQIATCASAKDKPVCTRPATEIVRCDTPRQAITPTASIQMIGTGISKNSICSGTANDFVISSKSVKNI